MISLINVHRSLGKVRVKIMTHAWWWLESFLKMNTPVLEAISSVSMNGLKTRNWVKDNSFLL